jgi:mono/diheme cytochrome c family protein
MGLDAVVYRKKESLPFDAMKVLCAVAVSLVILVGTTSGRDAPAAYTKICVSCHGADGSGHTAAALKMKVADLRSKNIQQMSDEDLYSTIAHGTNHKSYPHAFLHTGLTEAQVRELVKYIRTLGKTGTPPPG